MLQKVIQGSFNVNSKKKNNKINFFIINSNKSIPQL